MREEMGYVLLAADRAAEAETVFREDLERFPENGWSLKGLERALRDQGQEEAAEAVGADFEEAWQHADVEI